MSKMLLLVGSLIIATLIIGRAGHGLAGTWGNPFVLVGRDTKHRRNLVLQAYKKWLYKQPEVYLWKMDSELHGKILVCFCKPKLCHGDVIIEYLERNNESNQDGQIRWDIWGT